MSPHGAPNQRKVVGLFTDWLKDPYQNYIMSAVAQACAEHDANMLCFAGGHLDPLDSVWARRNILYEFAGPHNLDALVVMGANVGTLVGPLRLKQYLDRFPLPNVISLAYELPNTPSILVDNRVGLRYAIEHLVSVHGRRRIAFIRGPVENTEAEERFSVYRQVLAEHNIPFEDRRVFVGDFLRPSGMRAMQAILDSNVELDAVVAANDLMALGALEVLKSRGRKVPEDVALVGFDDVDEARLAMPQLTTVRQPFRTLGRVAVEAALKLAAGLPVANVLTVPTQVVIRRSCGCAANSWDETELYPGSIPPTATHEEIRQRFLEGFATLEGEGISIDEETAIGLFEAAFREIDSGVTGDFAQRLADVIRSHSPELLLPWNRLITVLSRALHSWVRDNATRRERSDRIARQVRSSIGDIAELAQGSQRVRLQRLTLELSEISKALTGSMNFEGIYSALDAHLANLGISRSYLSLYTDPAAPTARAKLVWSHGDDDPDHLGSLGRAFETNRLVPFDSLFGNRLTNVILEPLFFEREQLGLIALEMGPQEGVIYEAIRDQVSGAIRGAHLVERMIDEAKRRQHLEKEQAEREMKIAANIQTMILPKNQRVPGFEVVGKMIPTTNVGGDYYDIHPLADGCWLGVGDVVGHGLRSGLIMLMAQSSVSAAIHARESQSPTQVYAMANAVLFDNVRNRLGADEHMTLCLLRCYEDGRVQYAGAHEDVLVFRANTDNCERRPVSGIWAGIMPDVTDNADTHSITLAPGDVLLLHTDGIVEARNVEAQPFGLARLETLLAKHAALPLERLCDLVFAEVQSHMTTQEDDLTLVLARYTGRPLTGGSPV
jgi:DNA-binding LacI/PurR family transcriptional regulator/serine phosphatase RsbU (regulator of sigma subunit)